MGYQNNLEMRGNGVIKRFSQAVEPSATRIEKFTTYFLHLLQIQMHLCRSSYPSRAELLW
jgi:hypothetical protein